MRCLRAVLTALCVVATASCGGADDAGRADDAGAASTTTFPASVTTPTTAVSTTQAAATTSPVAPTATAPVDLMPIETLDAGLLCRDLAAEGYPYEAAAWYWIGEGKPGRMDADGNGVPCETVYPGADIAQFWTDPGNEGWLPVYTTWTVHPGCCSEPTTGPASPAGPIPGDSWPADGFYSANLDDAGGGVLELSIRRWATCGDLPDECMFDWPDEALTPDPASEVQRSLDLTGTDVVVIVRPINGAREGSFGALQGTGVAFAALVELLESSPPLVRPWSGWPDSVPGPYGTFLTEEWWITSLEIRDGAPIVWVWAGQIAG